MEGLCLSEQGSSVEARLYNAVVRRVIRLSVLAFTLASTLFLLSFLGAAALECFKAVKLYWWANEASASGEYSSKGIEAIALSLKAVEYILVAPLPYLFLIAIGNYLLKVGDLSLNKESQQDLVVAQKLVAGVKSFATALLASIIAVDMTGAVLKSEYLDIFSVLPQIAILLVICLYLYVLEAHR